MKTRFVISLLCVGAVAFACGPRARNDANASGSTTLATARTVSQQGAPRTPRLSKSQSTSPIAVELEVRTAPDQIRFALQVANTGKKTIELRFPSGQTHDFVIVDSLGREVWRWGRGRMFTQTLQNKLLSRGETVSMVERWDSPSLKPGRYTAVATLRSENYPMVDEAEFTVGGAALAAKD